MNTPKSSRQATRIEPSTSGYSPLRTPNSELPDTESDYNMLRTPNGLPQPNGPEPSTSDLVSTPRGKPRLLSPRTPTPFKLAYAKIEKKSGAIPKAPNSPMRLEDLTEILKKDQDSSTAETDSSLMVAVSFFCEYA